MEAASARISVEREAGGYTDRARAYKLIVDGEERGSVKHGESLTVEVPAGSHEVLMKIDWASSPPLTLELGSGEQARLRCRPNASPLSALYYSLFARKRYIALERA